MTVRRNKLWILSFAILYFCPTLCLARNLDSSEKLDLVAVTPRGDPNEFTLSIKHADVSNATIEDVASRNTQPEVPISKPEVGIDEQNVTIGNDTDEYGSDYSEEDYEYEVNGTEGEAGHNLAYKSNLDSNATGLTGDDESTQNGTLLTGSRKPEGREIDYNDYDYKPKNDLSDASYDPDEVGLEVVEEMQVIHPPKARKRKTKPRTRKRKRPSAEPIEGSTKLSRSRNRSQRGNNKKHKTARGPKPRKIQQQGQQTNHKIQQQQQPGPQQIQQQQHTLQQQQQQSQQQIPKQQDFPNAAGVQYNFGNSGLQKNVPQTAAIDDRSVASPSVYQSNPSIGYGSPQSSNNYPVQQQLPSSQLTSYSGQQLYQGQQLPPSQSDFSSSYAYPHGQFKISPLHTIYPNQDVSGRQNPSNQPATYPPIQTQDYYQNIDQYYRSQQNVYQPEVRSNQEFVRPSGGGTHFSYFKQQSPSSSGGISAALEISEPGSYDQLLYNLYNAGILPFVQPGYQSHAHDKMPDKMFRPPVIIQPSANVSVITGMIAPYSDVTPYGGYTSALYLNILDGIPHNYPSYAEGDAESVGSYKSEQDGDAEQDGGPVISYLNSDQLNSPARIFNQYPINLDEYKIPDSYFVKTGSSNLSPSLQNKILQSRIVDGTFKSSGILSSDDNSISSPETEGQLKETGSVDLGGGIQSGSFLNHDVQDLGFRSDNRLVSFPRRKKHEINANGDGIRSRAAQSDSSLAQSGSSLVQSGSSLGSFDNSDDPARNKT